MANIILKIFLKLTLGIYCQEIHSPVELRYYRFSKPVLEGRIQYGYRPVLFLLATLSYGFGGSQTITRHVLPHVFSTIAHIPTVCHPTHH